MWRSDEAEIEKIIAGYCEELFTSSNLTVSEIDPMLESLEVHITPKMNDVLTRRCSKEEGYEAFK